MEQNQLDQLNQKLLSDLATPELFAGLAPKEIIEYKLQIAELQKKFLPESFSQKIVALLPVIIGGFVSIVTVALPIILTNGLYDHLYGQI